MPFGAFTVDHAWHEPASSPRRCGAATPTSTGAGQHWRPRAGQGQGRGTATSWHAHRSQRRPPPGRQCRCRSPCPWATGRCREPCAWSRHRTPDRTGRQRGHGRSGGAEQLHPPQSEGISRRASRAPVGWGTSSSQTKSVTRAGKALWHCSHQPCRGQGSICLRAGSALR